MNDGLLVPSYRRLCLISSLKALPRFEGSHCPSQSNHEYVKRVDTGSYVRLEDVIKILIVGV
jgi:hypothetical protein